MINTRSQSHHPFVTFFTVLVAVSSLGQLVSGELPASIEKTLPMAWQITWSILMFAGSVVSLFGFVWRYPVTALHLERGGMTMMSFGAAAYALAIYATAAKPFSSLAGAITVAFVLACAYRAVQITRILRMAERQSRDE